MRIVQMYFPIFVLIIFSGVGMANAVPSSQIVPILQDFAITTNIAEKEHLLNQITHVPDAGIHLLKLAQSTSDIDTKWMSIRGIGRIKYKKATPFLIECLSHEDHWVRANAARALGELKAKFAAQALIALLDREKDEEVIEQTVLALQMIQAKESIPTLKKVVPHTSWQTRYWVLQAIGQLGSKDDVSFLAGYLFDPQGVGSYQPAAEAISIITKEDFGFPKLAGVGSIINFNSESCIERVRQWWKKNGIEFSR